MCINNIETVQDIIIRKRLRDTSKMNQHGNRQQQQQQQRIITIMEVMEFEQNEMDVWSTRTEDRLVCTVE